MVPRKSINTKVQSISDIKGRKPTEFLLLCCFRGYELIKLLIKKLCFLRSAFKENLTLAKFTYNIHHLTCHAYWAWGRSTAHIMEKYHHCCHSSWPQLFLFQIYLFLDMNKFIFSSTLTWFLSIPIALPDFSRFVSPFLVSHLQVIRTPTLQLP
jgi:hypothetical protein